MHKDKLGQVIYVGKASSLKNRVSQYFQASRAMDPKARAMVEHIEEFEYFVTETEVEALLLECTLIKRYMPKYNVLLRDDKTYPYIKVTIREEYPRLLKTRRIEKDGARYFGPYTDAAAVNRTIDLLSGIFRLKRCAARTFPPGFRPCLNYHIRQCSGICAGTADPESYRRDIEKITDFLEGRSKPLIRDLTEKMERAAENFAFEAAAVYRDQIRDLETVSRPQKVALLGAGDIDIVTVLAGERDFFAVVFFVREGRLSGKESFPMRADPGTPRDAVLKAFMEQYYAGSAQIPPQILIQHPIGEAALLETFLSGLAGRKVKIIRPMRGDKRALLSLVEKDLLEMSGQMEARAAGQKEREEAIRSRLEELIEEIGIPEGMRNAGGLSPGDGGPAAEEKKERKEEQQGEENKKGKEDPKKREAGSGPVLAAQLRIEAYDISNTNGVDSVGAMVVFEGSRPRRKDYRKFKIRTVEGPDDTGSLKEVLSRRFKRAKEEDPAFSLLPDLLLVDGGAGQVAAAYRAMAEQGVAVPVAGMAKDASHRTRALVYIDREGEIRERELKGTPLLFQYIGRIQEEVHRFAVEYHRTLRGKSGLRSALDRIEGIGPVKRGRLLTEMGSLERIRTASVEELAAVPGIRRKDAEKIYEFFH